MSSSPRASSSCSFSVPRRAQLVLLGLPARRQLGRLLLQLASSCSSFSSRSFEASSVSFFSASASICFCRISRSSASSSSGLRIDLHAQARGRLVHQVDRLVRQEAVGDVALRQRRRRDQRGVRDAHAVVHLVLLLDAAQDADRVLDRRLGDEDRLEAPGQCGVLLDMLAVLVERGRADAVQLAARQRGLQQVGGVHRALGLAGADQRVHLVDEQDHLARRGGDLGQHRLQPLLELAAILRAGDQRAHVERHQLLVLQASGTSPLTMRIASPSAMAVLPTPGSPIRTGLFLVRRLRTWMQRRISSSRPMTGSILPSRAASVRSRAYFFSAS